MVAEPQPVPKTGLITNFARHPTAPNILMVLMIALGIAAVYRLNTQFFPDYSIDYVSISVVWPGASAEDVADTVIAAIEPEVQFLDAIKRIESTAWEGRASILLEFEEGADLQKALSDVETAVSGVRSLPETSERPVVQGALQYDRIASIRLTGPYDEAQLREYAKTLRDKLLAVGADQVRISDLRSPELIVDVEPAALLALDLSLGELARRIDLQARDLPGGDTQGASELQVRMLGETTTAAELSALEIVSDPRGQTFQVGDLGVVSEGFEEGTSLGRSGGQPALSLDIRRAPSGDILATWNNILAYLDSEPGGLGLPDDLELKIFLVEAEAVMSRINMLMRNGLSGLLLVLGVLFVFLRPGVAMWVAIGIPTAFAATLVVMYATDQSINMISMFAMIMMLGIVVDDAIVVAEHSQMHWERGAPPLDAAVLGARMMLWPVLAASVTTMAAFAPVFFVSGIIGQIMSAIPLVVVAVLFASLVECFWILPGHMRHAFARSRARPQETRGFRRWFDRGFATFREGAYRRFIGWAMSRRYLMVTTVVALFLAVSGLLAGGQVKFVFFPSLEDEVATATFWFPAGTPRTTSEAMVDELERAIHAIDTDGVVETTYGTIGRGTRTDEGLRGDHLGAVTVQLVAASERDVLLNDVIDAWRAEVRPLPGLEKLQIAAPRRGPRGKDIDVRLFGASLEAMKAAAVDIQALLAGYAGVEDIQDNLPYGKRELALTLTQRGRALGFTTGAVAREVRGAFEGIVAQRVAAGDEELAIRVRMRRDAMEPHALGSLFVQSPAGLQVPLTEVVEIEERQGFSKLEREGGVGEVAVTANVDNARANATEIWSELAAPLDEVAGRHGVQWRLAGRNEEQRETLREMLTGAALGLLAIYLAIALVFGSYTRPLIVMVVIPFAMVGAVAGHWVIGLDLTIISLIGLLGLSGIVVNGSIIVVNTIARQLQAGVELVEAVTNGSCERLRAVIVTTVSTIGGLAPLLLETSFQAQILRPMVVTITFGLLATTPLVLVIVPSLFLIQNDAARLGRWLLSAARIRGRTEPAQ